MFRRKTKIDTSPEKIKNILNRGVEDVFVKESLEAKLQSGKQLRIKLGFDPTGSNIHIGRAVILRKLRAFQQLGHQIIFIVGDFTAQVGDPSDKLEKRPMLSKEQVEKNLKDYKKIVGKIIDVSKAEFVYNSKWLSGLGFHEISKLAESFTVQQMLNRRNFKDRYDTGHEISLREFMYPIMQGYDSLAVRADVEIGGFDQLFNVKAGRIIQKHYSSPEQDILTTQMLEGTDGRKMSTSWGNVINITDEPNDMFGKIMSVKDELISKYFLLCTDVSEKEIESIKEKMVAGENPKDFKMRLAREIVSIYHGAHLAEKAEQSFIDTFKKGMVPEDAPTISVQPGELLVDIAMNSKLVSSKTEWKRLVDEGAVVNAETGEKVADIHFEAKSGSYKIGKRRFIKIISK